MPQKDLCTENNSTDWLAQLTPGIARRDPYLQMWVARIRDRMNRIKDKSSWLKGDQPHFYDFAAGHHYFGFHHKKEGGWVFRDWAPHANAIFLKGQFNDWQKREDFALKRIDNGAWELHLPEETIKHGQWYHLYLYWNGGEGMRVPAWTNRAVQSPHDHIFQGQVWAPETPYRWQHPFKRDTQQAPLIYEAHIGMATEEERVGTYTEFKEKILPRIKQAGYNTIQLMAIQEHPYYGSFGYHVSSYFAPSSRFGTPEELKALIDEAHSLGIAVIMDIVHSHAASNEIDGISRYDGTLDLFFHSGDRGKHAAWDSRCFNYGRTEVLHFLLSNCRYWLEEFHFDGFRFDGVTSMLYYDHGLGRAFTGYDDYFSGNVDEDAVTYLGLANQLIHEYRPDALCVAEDVSGMPGLAASQEDGGIGFDIRLAMGTPDYWIKLIKEVSDENWNMTSMYHELTNKRADEKTVSYAESHDQAIVGDQTLIFRLAQENMYYHMQTSHIHDGIDRSISLHKMIRLITLSTGGGGYLNFMGNEFGHPEWIDFPRQGNGWSYKFARRQWSLSSNPLLKYKFMGAFDEKMIALAQEHNLLSAFPPQKILEHCDNHLLGFERNHLIFLFNFDAWRTATQPGFEIPAGRYKTILDSDWPEFGGKDRHRDNQLITSQGGFAGDEKKHQLSVIIAPRTCRVLKRIDQPKKIN